MQQTWKYFVMSMDLGLLVLLDDIVDELLLIELLILLLLLLPLNKDKPILFDERCIVDEACGNNNSWLECCWIWEPVDVFRADVEQDVVEDDRDLFNENDEFFGDL